MVLSKENRISAGQLDLFTRVNELPLVGLDTNIYQLPGGDLYEWVNDDWVQVGETERYHTITMRIPPANTLTTNWQTLAREVNTIFNLLIAGSSYNPILDTHTEPRCTQWILPFKCTLDYVSWQYSVLNTDLDINIFTATGGDVTTFNNGKTIASKRFAFNQTQVRRFLEYQNTEIDKEYIMQKNDIITLAVNNNGVATGDTRTNILTLIFKESK